MIVVSDASPLNYLVLIQVEEILPALFGEIIVPDQVVAELRSESAPDRVFRWARDLPRWVQARLGDPLRFPKLDPGEAAALAIAVDEQATLLVDEAEARSVARSMDVHIVGTIGIVVEAHLRGLLEFESTVGALT